LERVAGVSAGETLAVPRSAARLTPELTDLILEHDDPFVPIAEICRQVGERADRLGIARPSYERIRLVVRDIRERGRDPSTASVLVDVAVRARPPEALLDHVSGIGVSARRGAGGK
jgi:hypothetical protein